MTTYCEVVKMSRQLPLEHGLTTDYGIGSEYVSDYQEYFSVDLGTLLSESWMMSTEVLA